MALSLSRVTNISRSINSLCKQFTIVTLKSNQLTTCPTKFEERPASLDCPRRYLSVSSKRCDLMEFFDDKKNWGENEVRSGRSWRLDELRIKSNQDLHKLWYVLLKERNMLLTMEEECKEKTVLFPSPERIDKVKESMKNLETVVTERNKAYHLLETGETGQRPVELVQNQLGLRIHHKQTEHLIPKELNKAWREKNNFSPRGSAVRKFLLLYLEKKYLEKKRKHNRNRNHVMGLMKRFPNLDLEAVKEQYPGVDIDKCRQAKKARGHFFPK